MKQLKRCSKCEKEKPVDEFSKRKLAKDGHNCWCKTCAKDYAKIYCQKNKEKLREYHKKWYMDNKDRIIEREDKVRKKEYLKEYYKKNKNKLRDYNKKYREKNKKYLSDKSKRYNRARRKSDPIYKLKGNVRTSITMSFHRMGTIKTSQCEKILGCNINEFVTYLKQSWLMEYGTEWVGQPCHIDHIIPLATAKTEDDVVRLCHYSNLRLITPEDNMKKSNNLIGKEEM